ncbi:PRELI/slowmo family protein SCDLUD_001860 [Saccharomycodes ludwigii]|uniref:PRELI/slowmo family protein n=1 Tax=Saccharomycodes ludwigii TaxID=36035 RepID=UPI001E8963EE|nr:hypothetical protein SCDLUD_001860 [Saccharomycodes ludwigii]KAH3902049.1 hypothetical protein SCDLUD_001860 [Saccharomycodes ludwigii]
MKLFNNSCEFPYSWDKVTSANWRKYPNEMSTHVKAVDVLQRKINEDGTKLISERLITVKQGVPQWVMMLVGSDNTSYIREISVVDLNTKTLTMESSNLTGCNILKVFETVRYSPHPQDPLNKTLFEQEAQITAYFTFSKMCAKIEDWSVQRFHDNAMKGRKGFEGVLNLLFNNGDYQKQHQPQQQQQQQLL